MNPIKARSPTGSIAPQTDAGRADQPRQSADIPPPAASRTMDAGLAALRSDAQTSNGKDGASRPRLDRGLDNHRRSANGGNYDSVMEVFPGQPKQQQQVFGNRRPNGKFEVVDPDTHEPQRTLQLVDVKDSSEAPGEKVGVEPQECRLRGGMMGRFPGFTFSITWNPATRAPENHIQLQVPLTMAMLSAVELAIQQNSHGGRSILRYTSIEPAANMVLGARGWTRSTFAPFTLNRPF